MDALHIHISKVSKGSTFTKLMAELTLMPPISLKRLSSLLTNYVILPFSCYNYSVFNQMVNNF